MLAIVPRNAARLVWCTGWAGFIGEPDEDPTNIHEGSWDPVEVNALWAVLEPVGYLEPPQTSSR